MSWNIEPVGEVVVVSMTSNPVNMQNPAYFKDLNDAFDIIDGQYSLQPIVLTGTGNIFSAGIDFNFSFAMFERRNQQEIAEWYTDFRDSIMRVFCHPSLTIAAVNGHAFAGGLLLALACDARIAAPSATRFALNEVPIGIPMPMAYNELVNYRVGSAVAFEAIMTGKEYNLTQAHELGMIHSISGGDDLLQQAIAKAQSQTPETRIAYSHTKELLLRPILDRIHRLANDEATIAVISSPDSVKAQKKALHALKQSGKG
jgi:enoyl-CoA hydratase